MRCDAEPSNEWRRRSCALPRSQDILARPACPRSVVTRTSAALGWGPTDDHPQGDQGMTIQQKYCAQLLHQVLLALRRPSPAQALTAQECSAKYQAAKTAGTLNGQKWNDFRKAQCGADAAAAPAAGSGGAEGGGKRSQEGSHAGGGTGPVRVPRYSRRPLIRNTPRRPPARPACIPASINTTPTRPPTPMAG